MKRLLLTGYLFAFSMIVMAGTIPVKNIDELNEANKKAQAGDIIILKNGEWANVSILLTCKGTADKPIIFKAETAGRVLITGQSQLRLGGEYIVVDGLYFTQGYAGDNMAVIDFKISKNQLANHCRVTNTVIDDFNNPKRMDDNNWISFSGQYNRLDHCSFKNKKNMGVLLAVLLDDDRSRQNFHSIDHNYFGRRIALGSNGGEMIRVGVSQHCQFKSNTQITDNFFDQCDGETEIISIKSGSNLVKGNMFKESQGGVVLRHGDNNTVENNVFLGNHKEGTGGVRVINKGQWVINNFFYACRGVDFRSPLSLMNGIPNSPAHRYVQVTDAVIANNTFFDCASISFGEGSDTERTLPPASSILANNIFYNKKDSIIYRAFDRIDGLDFSRNEISSGIKQPVVTGFVKTSFTVQKNDLTPFPVSSSRGPLSDSLQKAARERLGHPISNKPGFTDLTLIKKIQTNAYTACGAKWFNGKKEPAPLPVLSVSCATTEEVYAQLAKKEPVRIQLTGPSYTLTQPFQINKMVEITTSSKTPISFATGNIQAVFLIGGNGHLQLRNVSIEGANVKSNSLVSNDSTGSSQHYNFSMEGCTVSGLKTTNGCNQLFFAYKYMIADSIVIRNNSFTNNKCPLFIMNNEKDNKGYYSAEKIVIGHNNFQGNQGVLLNVYRGGNDESTMGPNLSFSHNKVSNSSTVAKEPLIQLYGVQVSHVFSNQFTKSNTTHTLLQYGDAVRARHLFEKNTLVQSGKIEKDKFVIEQNNTIN